MMKQIVLATQNKDKVREILKIAKGKEWKLLSLSDFQGIPEFVEDGQTLQENALIKARLTFKLTGLPSLADDTGLEVDCLKGAPGVYSGRFAGEQASYADNNRKLIQEMQGVPRAERTARFRCVAALVHKTKEHCVEGICEGVILPEYHEINAFGYDPIFFVPDKGKTFAEMSEDEKNQISHRGRAFREMFDLIDRIYG